MPGILTYFHTLRHLKAVQFYGRVLYRVAKPRPDLRPPPPLRLTPDQEWVRPAERGASLVGPEHFCFLNEAHDLNDLGWDDPALGRLWRYNLHYFDDLNAQGAETRVSWHRSLLLRWVRENPAGAGTAWEPYPTSLRIVNWVKWARAGNSLPGECGQSLAVQARWLSKRLEVHLLGNHLFANAKALVFAGLFFEGPEANHWLETGMRILRREIPEQILTDGGQFERSTMYHALALEDMLDLCNLANASSGVVSARWQPTIQEWQDSIGLMGDWLAAMCHPDGEISFFNDAAFRVAPSPEELERYAGRMGLPSPRRPEKGLTHLSPSGYIRVAGNEAVALLDVAPIGPDYLPGHAHADTLSFELSLFGQRVLVNSGTSLYEVGPERSRQRGTAAHNTVIVDGQDSSEVWAGFRVAQRAHPVGLEIIRDGRSENRSSQGDDDVGPEVRCSHDGYRRLPGRPQHTRRWSFGRHLLSVEDSISGTFRRAEARFHLHPSVSSEQDGSVAVLRLPLGQRVRINVEGGALRTEASTWHPEFGRTETTLCVVVRFDGPVIRTRLDWAGEA